MFGYLIKRVANALIVLWVVTTITFILMHSIPGGPFTAEKKIPPAVQANIDARSKLNNCQIIQYK